MVKECSSTVELPFGSVKKREFKSDIWSNQFFSNHNFLQLHTEQLISTTPFILKAWHEIIQLFAGLITATKEHELGTHNLLP
jgi:hypothetical protein